MKTFKQIHQERGYFFINVRRSEVVVSAPNYTFVRFRFEFGPGWAAHSLYPAVHPYRLVGKWMSWDLKGR